jgi:cholesterol transport system auxiliary component
MTDFRPSRRHAIFAGAVLLSGCGSLIGPTNEPGKIYVLSPNIAARGGAARTTWQLAVAKPEASASLATERIAIVRGNEMDFYADAQWADGAPQLLQNFLVEALEKNGVAAAKDVEGIKADYILQTELRAFDARYDQGDAPPKIEIDVTARLISVREASILAAREFREEAQASANSISAAVAAFEQATAAILADIVRWVLAAAHR